MTQEEKQQLLKDLCARLPYGAKGLHREQIHIITNMDGSSLYPSIKVDGYDAWFPIETFKPYLRPMSSMTEEEEKEFINIDENVESYGGRGHCVILSTDTQDWLNAHHFDYRGLIEKGLALEAPVDMYKTE